MNCPRCDRPVATEADFDRAEQPGDDALCWDATTCPRKDWHAEALRLRAIVEGRAVPPTDEELAAHEAAGGAWLVQWASGTLVQRMCGDTSGTLESAEVAAQWRGDGEVVRWWPLDADRRPAAWPTPR